MSLDRELLIRIQNREEKALSELYELYERVLWKIICSHTTCEKTREKILHTVFQKIWQNTSSISLERPSRSIRKLLNEQILTHVRI